MVGLEPEEQGQGWNQRNRAGLEPEEQGQRWNRRNGAGLETKKQAQGWNWRHNGGYCGAAGIGRAGAGLQPVEQGWD